MLNLTESTSADFDRTLDSALSGGRIDREAALLLIQSRGDQVLDLLRAANSVRDRARRTISFSRKVFLPLTNLCRDYCGYCTFRKDPGDPGAKTLMPDEVLEVVSAGEKLGCKEALFSLGDKPELVFPEMRATLNKLGHSTTLAYLREMCGIVLRKSSLLPHVNPGLMAESDLRELKEVSISMGLMLENVSPRLMKRGGPHFGAPDKHPRLRLQTIEAAGRLQIPFTTGILIGIGETLSERIDSLLAIRELNDRYHHIQEIIIQNFRAKPEIAMRDHLEPTLEDHARTVAVARLLFGDDMNIQAPPNLAVEQPGTGGTDDERAFKPLHVLIQAGINDWGGISPLTIDYINPEKPWPHIEELRRQTEASGFLLKERLAIYPEFIYKPGFVTSSLASDVQARVDADGYPC